MTLELTWRTRAGGRTADNRDFAGIGLRDGQALCIVLDGSTRAAQSGELVRALARGVIDGFMQAEGEETAERLTDRLRRLHGDLARRWPRARASYIIAHVGSDLAVTVLHLGDCLLGRPDGGEGIDWLTHPDTLADVFAERSVREIAADIARHRVTRSFRAREFMIPGLLRPALADDLLLATDGFWADIRGPEQAEFLQGRPLAAEAPVDDRSCLRVRIVPGEGAPGLLGDLGEEGLYARRE